MQFCFISALFCSMTVFLAEVNGEAGNCTCQIDPQAHEAFCKLEGKLDKIMSAMQAGKNKNFYVPLRIAYKPHLQMSCTSD